MGGAPAERPPSPGTRHGGAGASAARCCGAHPAATAGTAAPGAGAALSTAIRLKPRAWALFNVHWRELRFWLLRACCQAPALRCVRRYSVLLSSAWPLGWPRLGENLRRWFSSDSASLAIAREHYFFSAWHTSLVWKPLTVMHKTLVIQMPHSLIGGREEEKEGRRKNHNRMCASTAMEWLLIFLFCLITISWKGFLLAKKNRKKDKFLPETTYATANFRKRNQLQSGMIAKILYNYSS